MQIRVRAARDRGGADHGWLRTAHTFSFADYHDPAFMGYRALRVINEDHVAPSRGFGMHPHRDMEIVTYVLEGELAHKDSMGNGSTIRPGDVQRMSAGTGVLHSEMNPSKSQTAHLLQIWILPDKAGYPPSYEQKAFSEAERRGALRVVASPDGRDGSVTIHQDATLAAALLAPGQEVVHRLARGRHAWVQVARGKVDVGGHALAAGDGAAVDGEGEGALAIRASEDAEVLVFDLA
ncbi:MAG TPA: pirin family protein [Kofleriaceae bacterium]|nr:pirin family protein [Kofleriaceae bacterium]